MRELGSTGFMSNRGRQNVASFLVYNLQVDWRWGAEYFETMLIDHHPCVNWGNWHSIAGLQRSTKIFSIARQSFMYDRKGAYVRHWIAELRCVPDELVHRPWAWDGRHKLKADKGGYFAVEPMASAVEITTNKKQSGSRSLSVEDWPITALEEKFYPHQPIIQLKNLCGGYAPLEHPPAFTPQTRIELKTRIDSCLNEALMELHSHNAPRTHVPDRAAAKPVQVVYLASLPVAMSGATPMTTFGHAPINASGTTPRSTSPPRDTAATNSNIIATPTVQQAATVSDWAPQGKSAKPLPR